MSNGALFMEPIVIATGGALTSTNVDGSLDPAAWSNAATYTVNQQVTYGESIYQSLQPANTGRALSDTAWWVRVGPINKMRMFDRKVGSQTENADTLEVVVTPAASVTMVTLRNLQALTVRVQQSTSGEGTLYDRTVQLDEPVVDWYDYFYSSIVFKTDAVFTGLALFSDSTITVTVDNTGSTAKCGELLMGEAFEAGVTEAGVQDGIDDYSLIQADQFGVRDIVERDFADNMELTVNVASGLSASLKRFLAQNRAKPIVVVASDARPDAQVFGLAESWRRVLSYPGLDVFNITMKGLT